jgi:hypothetical protein
VSSLGARLGPLGRYLRRNPVTAGYLGLLLATHPWADRLGPLVSTNLHNLAVDPVGSLVGSALVFDGTLTDIPSEGFAGTVITLGFGVAGALAWLERRHGPRRAFTVFTAGHVGATLLTAGVITVALRRGWYPDSIRQASDFGISYGSQAALGAAVLLSRRPRVLRALAAAGVLVWPLAGAGWSGPLPDFTTIGHLFAAGIGFAAGARLRGAAPRAVRGASVAAPVADEG